MMTLEGRWHEKLWEVRTINRQPPPPRLLGTVLSGQTCEQAPGRPEVTGQKPRAMAPSPWRKTRLTGWIWSAKCFLTSDNFILLTVVGTTVGTIRRWQIGLKGGSQLLKFKGRVRCPVSMAARWSLRPRVGQDRARTVEGIAVGMTESQTKFPYNLAV